MPHKRTYRRKSVAARRHYRRRTKRWPRVTRTVTVRNKGPTAFPDVFYTKLKYSFDKSLDTAINPVAGSIFTANDLFDPDSALGGQQPMGFDQYATIYNNYIVYACAADVTFLNQNTGANALALLWWQPAQDGTIPAVPTSSEQARERSYVTKTYVNTANAGGAIRRLKSYMTTKKMFGLKRLDISNTAYIHFTDQGGINTQRWFLYVLNGRVGGSSTILEACGTLTFYVRFFNKKPLARST